MFSVFPSSNTFNDPLISKALQGPDDDPDHLNAVCCRKEKSETCRIQVIEYRTLTLMPSSISFDIVYLEIIFLAPICTPDREKNQKSLFSHSKNMHVRLIETLEFL